MAGVAQLNCLHHQLIYVGFTLTFPASESDQGQNDTAHFFCGVDAWIDPRYLLKFQSRKRFWAAFAIGNVMDFAPFSCNCSGNGRLVFGADNRQSPISEYLL
jgi:hypothetical protein